MHWSELYIMDAAGEGPTGPRFVPLTAERAEYYRAALAEYRQGGGAQGLFIATTDEAQSYNEAVESWSGDDDERDIEAEHYDLSGMGPEPGAVDWGGLPF